AYGSPHAMTPTMDMLSRKGILFSQSLSSSSWTLPGVQNMLAGHYLHRFLCEAQPFHLAQDFEIPLIPAEFATAGYFTIGISANHLVSPEHGLDMGFDIFDTKASEKWMTWSTIPLYYRITELLSKYGDRPLFIYIHAMDPHDPYTPLEPFDAICSPPDNADIRPRIRQRDSGYLNLHPFKDTLLPLTEAENEFLRANYRGEVRQMDTFLLSFLEYLEELSMCDDLILAITADHGEEFGEHSSYQHGISLYEPVVRVPLILMDFVNDRSPEVVPARVSTIDVASTLLHMADVSTRATFEGINLLSPEAMADPDRLIYTIVRNHDEPEIPRWRLRSVYQNERKLTWQSRDVLTAYDLLRGPDESVFREFENWDAFFAADIDARWRGMGEQLKIFMDSLAERRQSGGMDKMLTQKLRDLGYIE
nr:sulfatase-like hydrolase/transferase [bacterium]